MSKIIEEERQEAIKYLKKTIKPMDTIYTILNHVSSSGMSRVIDCYVIKKNKPIRISHDVAKATGYKLHKTKDGITVGGCGMDMGFALVYDLASVLFKGGDGKTITGRNGDTKPETNGGYLLKQSWL